MSTFKNLRESKKVPKGYHCPCCEKEHDKEGASCCKKNHVMAVHVSDTDSEDIRDPYAPKNESLSEGAVVDTRLKLSSDASSSPAKSLAMAATKDANDYTTTAKDKLVENSIEHNLALAVLSARAQMAHIIAGHGYPEKSPAQYHHFVAASKHGAIGDHCKRKILES